MATQTVIISQLLYHAFKSADSSLQASMNDFATLSFAKTCLSCSPFLMSANVTSYGECDSTYQDVASQRTNLLPRVWQCCCAQERPQFDRLSLFFEKINKFRETLDRLRSSRMQGRAFPLAPVPFL